jgi:predicted HTH transcriptional regulator
VDGKPVFAVTIPKGDTICSTSKGLYYIRVGSTKQIPTQQELLRLFQKKNILQFDETPVLKAKPESIDLYKIDAYLAKLGLSPINREEKPALTHDLVNLSIIVDIDRCYYPTFGALLAFGKNPQKYFPHPAQFFAALMPGITLLHRL